MSTVDTSADGIHKSARSTLNDHIEKLRGFDVESEGFPRGECVEALSAVGELCREEGAAGEANRAALGEVRTASSKYSNGAWLQR